MSLFKLFQGRVTTASNVWTFGITAWEILTLCRQRPFAMLTDIGKMMHDIYRIET